MPASLVLDFVNWRNAIKPSKHVAESNPGLGTLNWIVSKKVIIINYWSGDIIIVCEPFLVDKTFSFFHYYKWICEQTYHWICFCERNAQNLMMACLSWKLIPRWIQLCWHSLFTLGVKLEATHKPGKPPTNHPQTSQLPDKAPNNQPKMAYFVLWKHYFYTNFLGLYYFYTDTIQ